MPSSSPSTPPLVEETASIAERNGAGSRVGKISEIIPDRAVSVSTSTPIRDIIDTPATAPGNRDSSR